MIKDYLKAQILANFGHLPTKDQDSALTALADFVISDDASSVFVLRGYAGTGKTSLVSAFVRTMEQVERRCVLLAPTGRAAKVFGLYAGMPAYTIHKYIYRQRSMDFDATFDLGFNGRHQVVFVVDEASMISDTADAVAQKESLLSDLVHYVYGGQHGCRLMLVGDVAQLPPVGEEDSPALAESVLSGYGLNVFEALLRDTVRQKAESGVLFNATALRRCISDYDVFDWPKLQFAGFADIRNVRGDELIDALSQCYARYGVDDTIVVCRSNKRANVYNNGIRAQILDHEDELSSGDQLMIARNNYFWMAEAADGGKSEEETCDFLANGDIAVVQRVRNVRSFYGFTFADCQLRLPDYDDRELTATLLLDTLHAEAPALTREQQQLLFDEVMKDYFDVPTKVERLKRLRKDVYYNALQVKYAYAVTCHKAQGGQWSQVFVDQGYVTEEMLGTDYYRWLYTAITRSTNTVWMVNWKEQE